MELAELPRAARPLAAFPAFLRGFGFALASDQTVAFMAAVALLGPRHMADIHRAAHATLAPAPERQGEFDALFKAFFWHQDEVLPGLGREEGDPVVKDARGGATTAPEARRFGESGKAASAQEILAGRRFRALSDDERWRRLRRRAPGELPRRRAFRRAPASSGDAIDMRRTLRTALRNEGDLPILVRSRRRTRQRNILLLIDVSGSMKAHSEDYLCFAHAVTQAADRVESFTFGTRLTRISRAMRLRDRGRALERAGGIVDDWDGGTRIGEALGAFLAVPRFAGYARGALTVVLSDGLERGKHALMLDAVRCLARRSWRLAWLTPLAADNRFRPETAALKAVLPWLDDLGDGGSVESLCDYVLSRSRDEERFAAARWTALP